MLDARLPSQPAETPGNGVKRGKGTEQIKALYVCEEAYKKLNMILSVKESAEITSIRLTVREASFPSQFDLMPL